MCDGGASDACNTATRDATTLNAIDVLQKCNGKGMAQTLFLLIMNSHAKIISAFILRTK